VLRSADELLTAYSGREDELLAYLKKIKAERRVEELVDELKPGRSASELLSAYSGREDELITNLEKMRSDPNLKKADDGSAVIPLLEQPTVVEGGRNRIRKEVDSLVQELQISRSTGELMNAYAGREDELLSHLRKLKASKS